MTVRNYPTERAVVCFGDSLTLASGRADRSYPSVMDECLFPDGFSVGNNGVSGGTFQNMTDVYQTYYKDRGLWAACLLVGVNDIAAGTSAAATYAGINALIQEMLVDELRVVVSTILPWKNGGGWTAPRQTITLAVNASLLALNGTNRKLLVMDGYSEFGDADDSALLGRQYQEVVGDGLHLGSYGCQALATLMRTGVDGLAGWMQAPASESAALPKLGSTYNWPSS